MSLSRQKQHALDGIEGVSRPGTLGPLSSHEATGDSLPKITAQLEADGVPTARGGRSRPLRSRRSLRRPEATHDLMRSTVRFHPSKWSPAPAPVLYWTVTR
jgi:hypothetical protein